MISVIGLGFVGLTVALGFAHKGHKVYGIDVNQEKLSELRNRRVPFYEAHLDRILSEELGRNFFLDVPVEQALNESDYIFICVGTPSGEDGSSDLSQVFSSLRTIVENLDSSRFRTVIVKSSVPPSSTMKTIKPYLESLGVVVDETFGLANNPEFLREGYAWEDFIAPDRTVVGCNSERTGQMVKALYEKTFEAPCYCVSWNTGEFIKYLSNTMLATMIGFANEMSMISDAIGDIDTKRAFRILREDKRWSGSPSAMAAYVYPGCGFGGYCLPKDLQAMISTSTACGYKPQILESVADVNELIQRYVAQSITKVLGGEGGEKRLGVLGLSFKPESDDVRETPARNVISFLLNSGITSILVFDPEAKENFAREFGLPVEYAGSVEEVCEKTDVVAILTAWQQFKEKKDLLEKKVVLDYRYML